MALTGNVAEHLLELPFLVLEDVVAHGVVELLALGAYLPEHAFVGFWLAFITV